MKSFFQVLISVIPIPILMMLFGFLWKKYIPKSKNWIYGYRSIRAMKNDSTWKFAQLYQAKVWRWSGSILLIFALFFSLSFTKGYKEIPIWIFYTELGLLILTIIPTEITLRRKFDKEGSLRSYTS